MKTEKPKAIRPAQKQDKQPGIESKMTPLPEYMPKLPGKKLENKVAIITGGDSGIGRAVAIAFAQEGATVLICYLDEHKDAEETLKLVKNAGGEGEIIAGDIGDEKFCARIVKKAVKLFGRLDILVNNAAMQFPQKKLEDISSAQLEKTFRTNIFSQFYLTQAALEFLKEGSSIICTTSVTAFRGSPELIDYAATKGAIVGFIRSLAGALADRNIRVNGVAPGPIWTPLIPSSFDIKKIVEFGSDVPMKRAGQPNEVAPCYVFLASDDASYFTGQIMHPNGGEIVNA